MLIDDKTLPSMVDFGKFKEHFEKHAQIETNKALLAPQLSLMRMKDAHYAWRSDMNRIETHEPKLQDGADHFKQCAALAYWIRRMSPIVEYRDLAAEIEGIDDLYSDEIRRREFMARYGAEFIAFDFGFQICLYYETERLDTPYKGQPELSGEYLTDVCHMMKFKHISPHSMFLVYKSIFVRT